jgi:malonyl-CoA O-methyltransferase
MSNRKQIIKRHFNRSAAGTYDQYANVQCFMADRLVQSLQKPFYSGEPAALNILEIGCGTGTLTEMLANKWSCSMITALDIAPEMIKAAEHRLRLGSGRARIRFLHADVEEWVYEALTGSFDLIVANACFQWLSEPSKTLRNLRGLLRSEGLLVFTTFGPDTFRELHEAFNAVYNANGNVPQRHGLSFQSASEWKSMLAEAGFSTIQAACSTQIEIFASVREFLHSVKAVGASASEAADKGGFSSRSLFTNMYMEYEKRFSLPEGIAATYELLLFQAQAAK